jgi:hypothetical protein
LRVFDEIPRTSLRASRNREPHSSYLNESGRPVAEEVRRLIEAWFMRYPDSHKKSLVTRLRSPDDQHFLAAFFELYVHELLLRLRYEPVIPGNAAVSEVGAPEFDVGTPLGRFVLEAVHATDASQLEAAAESRLNDALDAINEVRSDHFRLHVEHDGVPRTPVSRRAVRKWVEDFLGSLSPESIRALASTDLESLPKSRFEHDGLVMLISPIPTRPGFQVGPDDRLTGVVGPMEAYSIQPRESLRKALRAKASRYGSIEAPFVIAANTMAGHFDRIDAMEALFGKEGYHFGTWDKRLDEPVMVRAPDGLWHGAKGPTATRVSAVIITNALTPWTVAAVKPVVYHNPWAARPITGLFGSLTTNVPVGTTMVESPGLVGNEIFELPTGWPAQAAGSSEPRT